MATYDRLFSQFGLAVAQLLLIYDDLQHHERHLNARNTLVRLLARGIVPIINENDVEQLGILIESAHYFEVDLVLTHEVDPHGLIVNYLGRHFIRQQELVPNGPIRIIPFRNVSPS